MAPPDTAKAAPALDGNGPRKTDRLGSAISPTDNTDKLVAQYREACRRLERFTDDLAQIADWRDDIARRVWRAQARFEFVDAFDRDEEDHLVGEVHEWRAVCNALGGRSPYAERGS